MKNIKILVLLLSFSMVTTAQIKQNDRMEKHETSHHMSEDIDIESRAMMYADKMTTRLSLTLEQKEKIKEAQINRLTQQRKLHAEMLNIEDSEEKNSDKNASKKNLQDDFRKTMKQILTPDQFKKWEPMHKREVKSHSKKAYKKGHEDDHGKSKEKKEHKDKH
jgi:periplasmic protein CpxP/Spy